MSIKDRLKKAASFSADILAPNRCPCCSCFIKWDMLLCEECRTSLRLMSDKVRETPEGCCEAYSAMWYIGKAKQGIYTLKEGFGKNFAVYAASLLKDRLGSGYDLVTCVPSNLRRGSLSARGHAETFALAVSDALDIPCDTGLLKRAKTKTKQHDLSAAERAKFAKTIYSLTKEGMRLDGKHILLADDVLTTGSTISTCAKLLLGSGAESITAITLCRTPLDTEEIK